MFAVLEAVPEIVIVLLFATAFAAILAFLPLAGSRVFHISVGDQTSDAMQRAQTAVTGFTAIVAAFSLVQAQITLANIQKLVSNEADQVNQLDRLLTRYGDPSVGRIRETLRAYAESVVRDEWPELSRGRGSPITTRLFTPLSKSILAIDPSPGRQSVIYTDILKYVDNLAESRSNRLLAAHTTLPAIFWDVILLLLALLAGFALLGEARRGNAVALAGQGFGLAMLIGLVFVLDFPFYGETVVSTQPLVSALEAMHARTG